MIRLALATLRSRIGGFVGSFLAATLAVALISASGLLLFSALDGSPGDNRFAATAVTVSGPRVVTVLNEKNKEKTEELTGATVLSSDLVGRMRGAPGAREVIGDVSFPIELIKQDTKQPGTGANGTTIYGHGWQSAALTPYTLRQGQAPGRGEIVIDEAVARNIDIGPGATVLAGTRTGVRSLRVSGVVDSPYGEGLDTQGAAFIADDAVREVSGLDGVTAIGVLTDPGTNADSVAGEIRSRADGARVLVGEDRVEADHPGALASYIPAVSTFATTGGISLFAAVFVLIGTIAFSVRQRLRQLALLRTVGATPRQLRRMLRVETFAVVLVAAAIGCVLGALLAISLADSFRKDGVAPLPFEVDVNPLVILGSAAVGLIAAQIATYFAARRAIRIAPTEALRETVTEPAKHPAFRIIFGLVLAAGAVAVLIFTPLDGSVGIGMSFVSCILLLGSAAALGPVVVGFVGAILGRAVGAGVTGHLAAANTRAATRRATGVALPLMLMIAMNSVMILNNVTLAEVAEDQEAERVAPASVQLTSNGGIPLEVAEQAGRIGGVTGTAATIPTTVIVNDGQRPVEYLGQGLWQRGSATLDLQTTAGDLGQLNAGTLAVSKSVSDSLEWTVGSTQTVWLPDGSRNEMKVVAEYERSIGFGDFVLPADLVASHDRNGLASAVFVKQEGQADFAGLIRQWPAVSVVEPGSAGVSGLESGAINGGSIGILVAITLGFIAIAVVNTFAIAATERRREFANLRLAGATRGQVRRMISREALLIVLIGLLLGSAITLVITGMFSLRQDGVLRLLSDPIVFGVLLLGTGLLGLLSGIIPNRLVMRSVERGPLHQEE